MSKLYEILKAELKRSPNNYSLIEKAEEYRSVLSTSTQKADDYKIIQLYIESLELFFSKNGLQIVDHQEQIALNYFINLYKMCKYANLQSFSSSYLNEFRIFGIRIMELALYAQQHNIEFNNLFFNSTRDIFYDNLIYLYEINFETKNKKSNYVCSLDQYFKVFANATVIQNAGTRFDFKSTVKYPHGYKQIGLVSYLRIKTEALHRVYHAQENLKEYGGGSGVNYEFERLDEYITDINFENKIIYIDEQNKEVSQNDDILESVSKSRKRILNSEGKIHGIQDLKSEYNKYVDNKFKIETRHLSDANSYKKFKINTAISNNQAKLNLDLKSLYRYPELELLIKFLNSIKKKEDYNYRFLVATIVLGIQPEIIMQTALGISKDFELVHNDQLRVKLTTPYAKVQNLDFFMKSDKKVEFKLPEPIKQFFVDSKKLFFSELQEIIQKECEKNNYKNFIDEAKNIGQMNELMLKHFKQSTITQVYQDLFMSHKTSLSKFLTRNKKTFNKKIVLTFKNLHLLSMHYYKLTNKESHASFLFVKNKTANIHASLAYYRTPKQLTKMSFWIEDLLLKLDNCNINSKSTERQMEKKYSGSDKCISGSDFKNLILVLSNLKLQNEFANLTIKMIHMRFVFSILFVTRAYYFSANIKHYIPREKILFKHEKAKHITTSKCIIPVTDLGNKYIEYFLRLKNQLNFQANSPIIFSDDGAINDFERGNLSSWFNLHSDEILSQCKTEDFKLLSEVINDLPMDFGRHIFATEAHISNKLEQEYLEAAMNHFENGTQDQGIYSLFNNPQYFTKMRGLMLHIEKKYIPFLRELA